MLERVREAVVLAAGAGRRLGGTLVDRPKGFLTVGSGTLIERSLDQLRTAGVERVVLVAGYRADAYRGLATRRPDLVVVENPAFATTESFASLGCAASAVRAPFLLVESDLLYESRALSELQALDRPNAILLSGPTGAGDEVYVEAAGERLRAVSKDRTRLASVRGELVGISKIGPALFGVLLERRDREESRTLSYEEAIAQVADRVEVFVHLVEDLAWTEIDDPAHLERARSVIYPRIERLEAARRRSENPGGEP